MDKQQSFVITGGSSFLGQALAKMLSKNPNYKILITSRRNVENELSEVLGNKKLIYLPHIDLTKENDLEKFRNEVDNFFSESFHVINCLGYFPIYDTIEHIDMSIARKIFDGNILTLYAVAHTIIPLMCQRGGGHFIGFSTHTSYQNYPRMAAFTASKVAVESLIKSISNEYLSCGIIANTIALATLKTDIELQMKPNGDHENWLDTTEVYKIVENLILYSNNMINGSVLHAYKYSKSYFEQSYFDRIKGNRDE